MFTLPDVWPDVYNSAILTFAVQPTRSEEYKENVIKDGDKENGSKGGEIE